MDLSLISAAATSLGLARDFGKAAMAVRDFNEMATIVSKLNDQILKAQDSLFALQSELLREQQEHFEALKKVREMEQALDDRREYSLVEIGNGLRAYQRKTPAISDVEGAVVEPQYFCQPCFEGKALKSTLQPALYMGAHIGLECRICKERFLFQDKASVARAKVTPPRGNGGPNSWMGS
ncbi:hypothetical protein [Paraburkholderia heleia]|uniref:hypothetical protein n=1 Tax=Paraburkholderia heleia TaxID=634127 RepID=UPI0005A714C2|nr:hypothetical protein [Paraburkholderia heleia]